MSDESGMTGYVDVFYLCKGEWESKDWRETSKV